MSYVIPTPRKGDSNRGGTNLEIKQLLLISRY